MSKKLRVQVFERTVLLAAAVAGWDPQDMADAINALTDDQLDEIARNYVER